MSGFNNNLPKEERVQCLCCLSTTEPKIENNKVICSDCGSMIQSYLNMNFSSADYTTQTQAQD